MGDTVIKAHYDVSAQSLLMRHSRFGGKVVLSAVGVGAEQDAIITDFPQ